MKEEKNDLREPDNREPDNREPVVECGPSIPYWQQRLLEERDELFQRTIALKNTFSNPEMKLNEQEWQMLHRQYEHMRRYFQVLTDRCNYYKLLVEPANLDLCYETPCGGY